jgi:hypothetical protein
VTAAASPPAGSPPQYSPALRRVTTGFGMGPGGTGALSATGTSDPRRPSGPCWMRGCQIAAAEAEPGALVRAHTATTGSRRAEASSFGAGGAPRSRRGAARRGPPRCAFAIERRCHARPRPLGRLGSGRLPAVHPPPIHPVVSRGPYLFSSGGARLGVRFPLRCFQRFARPDVATRRCRGRDNRPTSGPSGPVLSY